NSATAFQIQNASSSAAIIASTNNVNTGYNAADATLKVGKDSVTNRSINAAGSVNASGADYAEYIPWTGAKPAQGSIVSYNGSTYVVSAKDTAAFVGNDILDEANSILVTFAGQVPVRVTGAVSVGDILIDNGDMTARAVNPATATVGQLMAKLAIAQESSTDTGVKLVKASVGTTSSNVANALQSQSSTFNDMAVLGTATVKDLNVSGQATIANLTVTGNVVVQGSLTVTTLAVGDITISGHVITSGGQPVATAQIPAGTGSTVVVSGTDTTGTITITTGANPTAGELAKLAFTKAYGAAPRIVLSPSNDNASDMRYFKGASDANGFMFNAKSVPAPNTTYTFDYFIAQ
ncbi:MAG: hypothetical protein QFB87_05525, partial [Patescibacteria group bacterium]|nr:hypothetical protein [Patescibacteria group bacterium]